VVRKLSRDLQAFLNYTWFALQVLCDLALLSSRLLWAALRHREEVYGDQLLGMIL
jgi:hypothetical protein